MFRLLFGAVTILVFLATSSAGAEAPVTRARFTELYAEAVRNALPSARVRIVGELELRVEFPNGRTATSYLDNAYTAYEQDPGSRDRIIARYVERAVKNLAEVETKIDPARVIPVIRGRQFAPITEAERNPASPSAVVFDHFSEDLVIIYGEDRSQDLRYFTGKLFAEIGIARGRLREVAVTNLRRIIGEIEYKDYGGTYMLLADGANEASLLLLPEIWTKQKLRVDGDFVVAIPTRDVLVVTGSNDADAIERVRALARESFANGPYSISPKLYRFRDGKLTPL